MPDKTENKSKSKRTALVLGATGLVGARALVHLAARPEYERIVCLVRRANALGGEKKNEKVEERVVDFDALTAKDVGNADDVYCAIGSTMKKAGSQEAFRKIDYDIPFNATRLAVESGSAVRLALVSSIGADATSSTFYLKVKGELEDALAELLADKKAFHILQPSFLVPHESSADRPDSRPGERVGIAVAKITSGLMVGGLRKYRPISVDTVGRAMVAAMVGPDPEKPNKKVYKHDALNALAERL